MLHQQNSQYAILSYNPTYIISMGVAPQSTLVPNQHFFLFFRAPIASFPMRLLPHLLSLTMWSLSTRTTCSTLECGHVLSTISGREKKRGSQVTTCGGVVVWLWRAGYRSAVLTGETPDIAKANSNTVTQSSCHPKAKGVAPTWCTLSGDLRPRGLASTHAPLCEMWLDSRQGWPL